MRTRTNITAVMAALAVSLVGCSGSDGGEDAKPRATKTAEASSEPSTDVSAAEKAAGIPPEPTGAKRAGLLRALAAANPGIVKYEDKAIDAARNQCSAVNNGSGKADWAASQRFTYEDVTTTEAQGKQINEALKGLGFCET
ncbi:hypothetical protein GCM10010300_02050 [Streptomyces olivaceoviridis]|uniref:hypothetical protein n=1 Tax=Streptomyces olivaceoviridis TaxID=1921 RepID=UPI0016734B4C|nr:hypothetical protein [Streptomyces olivaceoviridis]GGY62704.1 hypothetical protein GCM10010300_02050 [Streptomyces olivaceoviridis]